MLFGKIDSTRARATTTFLTCGIVATGLFAGCGDKTPDTSTTVINQAAPVATTRVVPAPGASGAVVTNDTNAGAGGATGIQTALADEISKIITRNTQMTGSRVNVVVDDAGVATLTGFTQNQQQKALAEKAARSARGIIQVINKLDIRPTGGTGKSKPPAPPAGPQTQIIVVPGAPAAPPAGGAPVAPPSVSGAPGLPPGQAPAGGPSPEASSAAPPAPTNP